MRIRWRRRCLHGRGLAAEVSTSAVKAPEVRTSFSFSAIQIMALLALFATAPVLEVVRLTALANTDVWWHLRTGLWILQTHALPQTGMFSQHSTLPWHASSWGYDVLVAAAYKLFGLRAIVIVLMAFRLAFAAIAYGVGRAAGAGFWTAVVLAGIAQYVVPGMQPTASSVSVLFFGVELLLLLQGRRSGNLRVLFWLLPLFLVWANTDVQAVAGLLLLILFLAAIALEEFYRRSGFTFLKVAGKSLPMKKVSAVVALSIICALFSPYSFHIFADFGNSLYSSIGFEYFAEMRAMPFRHLQEYVLMLLVMTAFLTLGRRRSLQAFELLVMLAGTLLAFRIQRDAWVVVLAAIAVIGGGFSTKESREQPDGRGIGQLAVSATLAGIILVFVALRLPSNQALLAKVSQNYPVQACDFIARNHLPQPLFNVYSWGGFVMWYMPEYPVSVDSRVGLYGNEWLGRYFQLISGKARLDADTDFALAKTLLLERQSGMTKALINLPALSSQYKLAYSDDVAAVFVKQ